MKTEIRIPKDGEYLAEFATYGVGSAGLLRFAWVYVTGYDGKATVTIEDTDGEVRGPSNVPVPGMFSSVIRESSGERTTKITVKAADGKGFKGELHVELLKNWRGAS